MEVATLTYGGLTLWGGPRGQLRDHYLMSLDGWESFTAERNTMARSNAHGQWAGRAFVRSKTVVAKGWSLSRERRDEVFQALGQAMSIPGSGGVPQDLLVDTMGRALVANATITAFDPWDEYEHLKDGRFGWKIEWTLDDPFRYAADEDGEYTTGLAHGSSSGLEFPLFDDQDTGKTTRFLEFGDPSPDGRVVFVNRGTTDAWPEFEVTSSDPFRIVHAESGRTIEYSASVPKGQSVVINQRRATAILQGSGDRSLSLTRREWFSIPAGATATIRFVTDTLYRADSRMTVRVRSTWL